MLNQEQVQTASLMVREFRTAFAAHSLDANDPTLVQGMIGRFLSLLEKLLENRSSAALGMSEGRLMVEATPLDERLSGSTNNLKEVLTDRNIQSLTFTKGVRPEEVAALFDLLKPGTVPSVLSLSQSLVQAPMDHIHVNERAHSAVRKTGGEGTESVVSSAEEEWGDVLEALQYFQLVLEKLPPDIQKRGLALLTAERLGYRLPDQPAGTGEKASAPGDNKHWIEMLNGLWEIDKELNPEDPSYDVKAAREKTGVMLKKMATLWESRGARVEGPEGPAVPSETLAEEQESLFETDPVLLEIDSGRWEMFWDPAMERATSAHVNRLLNEDGAGKFQTLWLNLWAQALTGDAVVQAICLRHLGRLDWAKVPRSFQLDGFRDLQKFLLRASYPDNFPLGLSLVQAWLPYELDHSHWKEMNDLVGSLKRLAEGPPQFEKQDLAARAALSTVFCRPMLDVLYARFGGEPEAREPIGSLFTALGPWTAPFLAEKLEGSRSGSREWERVFELTAAMGPDAGTVLKEWFLKEPDPVRLEKVFQVLTRVQPPAGWGGYCLEHWPSFPVEVQEKALSVMEKWPGRDFRALQLFLLEPPETLIAHRALAGLSATGIEGDSKAVIAAVKKYTPRAPGRERFWISACQALGAIAEPFAINALIEWADAYKFMENKKDRTPEVRKAAILALGSFHSHSVKYFLTNLREEDKENLALIESSLAAVEEGLKRRTEARQEEKNNL